MAQFRVGAPEPDGISRQGNPAEARLVAARTLPIRRDAHVGPRASRGEIIGPQERREAGVDGSGTAIRGDVPGIVVFLDHFRWRRRECDGLEAGIVPRRSVFLVVHPAPELALPAGGSSAPSLTFLKYWNSPFASHLYGLESKSGLPALAHASKSWRDPRSKNMPLMALLPPTTFPTRTRAVLLSTSSLGSELKVHLLAWGPGPPHTVAGGSKDPGAYSITPYSTTRTFPNGCRE